MWTAWNDCIEQPQIWDILHERDPAITSAVWFPLHSKGCGADYICTPAPIHNPDGSESLWCYTKPERLYGELRDTLGHFPLQTLLGTARRNSIDRLDRRFGDRAAAKHIARTSSTSTCRTWITPPRKSAPTARPRTKPLVDLDAELGKLIAGFEAGLQRSRRSGSSPASTRSRRSIT